METAVAPPEFSTWKYVHSWLSHILPPKLDEVVSREFNPADMNLDTWVARVFKYSKECAGAIGIGQESLFFGQEEARLKYWGLQGEQPPYAWFAILDDRGVWQTFSNRTFQVKPRGILGRGINSKVIVGIKLAVYKGKEEILVAHVNRNSSYSGS